MTEKNDSFNKIECIQKWKAKKSIEHENSELIKKALRKQYIDELMPKRKSLTTSQEIEKKTAQS